MSVHYWGESADGHWKLSIFTQEGLNSKCFQDEWTMKTDTYHNFFISF